MVEALLVAGAPLFESARTGKSALHLACEAGHEAVARTLLFRASKTRQDGARELMVACDETGRTAVEAAVANELNTMAQRLHKYVQELQTETFAVASPQPLVAS